MMTKSPDFAMNRRAFVDSVRHRIHQARPETPFRATWIKDGPAEWPFVLEIPVGAEHRVPVFPDREVDWFDAASLDAEASRFAKALIAVHQGERSLVRYIDGMRAAARKEISRARAEGLDARLIGLDFGFTRVGSIALERWQDAMDYVLAELRLELTNHNLAREIVKVIVGDVDELAFEISRSLEGQAELEARIRQLDGMRADLSIDPISIALLRSHDIDSIAALARLTVERNFELEPSADARLLLSSTEGRAEVYLETPDFCWNGKCLWPRREIEGPVHEPAEIADITDHPVFAGVPIIAREGSAEKPVLHLHRGADSLFDADTGRLWSPSAIAA